MNFTTEAFILKGNFFKTHSVSDLRDMLFQSAKLHAAKPAFHLKDENGKIYSVTYETFKNDVEALGTKLLQMNLGNQKICVIGKNSYQWAVSYLAACIVGVVVPIDKELHTEDIINFVNVAESAAFIGDSKFVDSLAEHRNKIKNSDLYLIEMNHSGNFVSLDTLIESGKTLLKEGDTKFKDLEIDPNAMHILLFTSGTTGNAKGVCLSHTNICSNIISIASVVKVDPSVAVLSILPIHHTYECTIGFLLIIYAGGSIAFCEGLRHISKNINEFKPNFILCVPLLLENVHDKIMKSLKASIPQKYQKEGVPIMDSIPFYMRGIVKKKIKNSLGGRMKTFIVGAASMNPAIVESFFKFGIKVLQGYGLTECSPLVAGNNDFKQKYDSVGLPIPNVEYKIDNPNQDGIGEIIVKGPNVMLGYYNNPEETNKVLVDGWFHTGDLGKIDKQQFLYITGRCKTVIVTKNGKNIYPEEIEYYLNENPLISESMILGECEEQSNDISVRAQIFPNIDAIKEYLQTKTPSKEDIKKIIGDIVQKVNSNLPNYKHIKSFKIRDEEFEKTTTKKIKRFGNNVKDETK